MAGKQVHIDFDQILDLALKGVRRTAVFMGLGMNAAANPGVTDFSLNEQSFLRLVPEEQAPETVAHYKSEFGKWIVGNGLRELLENFETFLTGVFDACMVAAVKAKVVTYEAAERERNSFTRGGLSKKVEVLDKLGVTGAHSHHFASLYNVRNCLTHRQGLVSHEDCKDATAPGKLVATWLGMTVEIHEPSGNVIPLATERSAPHKASVFLPDGGNVVVRILERRFEWAAETVVDLAPGQVAEICNFVIQEAQTIVNSAVAYVEGPCGLPVQRLGTQESPPCHEAVL